MSKEQKPSNPFYAIPASASYTPSRIVRLSSENVKRIRAVSITPTGDIVTVGGRNAQGKSSFLDSILYALNGGRSIPAEPIRRGEENAKIVLETERLVIVRKFTPGGTTLEVTNKEGLKYGSPQKILDELTTTLAFDPLSFSRSDKKDQFKQLQTLLGIDTATIDAKKKEIFDKRTTKNREVKDLKAVIADLPASGPERVDIRELVDELTAAQEHNTGVDEILRDADSSAEAVDLRLKERDVAIEAVRKFRVALETAEMNVEAAKVKLNYSQEYFEKAQGRAVIATKMDVEPIRQRIKDVEETNRQSAKVEERATKIQELAVLEELATNMTIHLGQLESERAAMLSGCKMPVPGIGFEADGVTLNGLPLEQASAAEQLKLGVAVACAMNPKMRVMLVRDGSLLDNDSMAMLAEMAAAHDAQIWVERVGNDGNCTVVIEDGAALGEVTSVDGHGEAGAGDGMKDGLSKAIESVKAEEEPLY